MTKPLLSQALAAIAMLLAGACANASVVSLSASISPTTLLDAGTHAGVFDGSAVLPATFQLAAATYSFTFTDDDRDASFAGPMTTSTGATTFDYVTCISCGGSSDNIYYSYYERHDTSTQTISREGESASVSLGSGSLAGGSGSTAVTQSQGVEQTVITSLLSSGGTPGSTYKYNCGYFFGLPQTCYGYNPGSYYDEFLTVTNDVTVTYTEQTGSFVVSGAITDAGLLAEITANRGLGFNLSVLGDLFLSDATLSLTLSDTGPDIPATRVPEPASLGLVGVALAGMGLVRRGQAGKAPRA